MLTMRNIRGSELNRFRKLEGECHYMGETRSCGDTLRLVAEEDGERVALMVWGSACYRLKDRDAHIGWTASLRALRQKPVVQNRRFTLLAKRGGRPNLASGSWGWRRGSCRRCGARASGTSRCSRRRSATARRPAGRRWG